MLNFKTRLKPSPHLIDLTPLVDVIFLLLIFFIVTSDILPLKSLSIESPHMHNDVPPLTARLVVFMDAQHVIYVGNKKKIVDFFSLKEHLLEEKERLARTYPETPEPSVVLNIDKRVDYETFLKLFRVASECSKKVRLTFQPIDIAQTE